MAFNMTTSGSGWRLAGSLVQLGHEVAAAHPDFTCEGTIGDAAHAAQGTASDHNPFVTAGGVGIVRAIDIGGPDAELKQLRQHLWDLYASSDDRLFEFGYVKGCSDNQINNWGLPFGHHTDLGDAGHLHISVTQKNGNSPSAAGYVPAIDDMRSWGINGATFSGSGTQIVATEEDEMDATQNQYLIDVHGAVGRLEAAGVEGIPAALTAIETQMKAQSAITLDYTQLAAALLAQLKKA